uniref:Uncharacterized protein n=1 Tax=Trepomonas sp. PC1 TaxID=1076344 RepID=A0A146K180_9EUKA|eukprot:JAP89309.1 Hypothetical protein TPC1_31196 [Trepomonas sp. PC1]
MLLVQPELRHPFVVRFCVELLQVVVYRLEILIFNQECSTFQSIQNNNNFTSYRTIMGANQITELDARAYLKLFTSSCSGQLKMFSAKLLPNDYYEKLGAQLSLSERMKVKEDIKNFRVCQIFQILQTKSRLVEDHIIDVLTGRVSKDQKDIRRACWAITQGMNRYNLQPRQLLAVVNGLATEKDIQVEPLLALEVTDQDVQLYIDKKVNLKHHQTMKGLPSLPVVTSQVVALVDDLEDSDQQQDLLITYGGKK